MFVKNLLSLLFMGVLFIPHYALASSRYLDSQKVSELTSQSETGNASAQNRLGQYYFTRNDTMTKEDDNLSAAKWFRLASDQGNAEAQFYLSGMYKDGLGVRQDYVEGFFWSHLSVKNSSCLNCRPDKLAIYSARLNEIENHITDIQKKSVEARVEEWTPTPPDVQFLELKAARGDTDAQYQVGKIYAEGKIVGRNRLKAFMCMQKAAQSGNAKAKEALSALEPTPEQRARPGEPTLGVPVVPHSPAPHACDYPF